MKIGIVSDSHGKTRRLRAALEAPGATIIAVETTPDVLFFINPCRSVRGAADLIEASPIVCNWDGVTRGVPMVQVGTPTDADRLDHLPLHLEGRPYSPLCVAAYAALIVRVSPYFAGTSQFASGSQP